MKIQIFDHKIKFLLLQKNIFIYKFDINTNFIIHIDYINVYLYKYANIKQKFTLK